MTDQSGRTPSPDEAEMLRLERRMYDLAYDDPERAKVVRRYNALCDKLEVPSGDNC